MDKHHDLQLAELEKKLAQKTSMEELSATSKRKPFLQRKIFRDRAHKHAFLFMLGLLTISLLIYFLPLQKVARVWEMDLDQRFWMNYILALAGMVVMLYADWKTNRLKVWKYDNALMTLALSLFYVSAFSLNRDMAVFEPWPVWLSAYLILSLAAMLIFSFSGHLPKWINLTAAFVLGAGSILHLFLAVYLAPMYWLAAFPVVIFLSIGVSMHLLVCLFSFIRLCRISYRGLKYNFRRRRYYLAGAFAPVSIIIFYCVAWGVLKNKLDAIQLDYQFSQRTIPEWMYMDQRLSKNMVYRHLLDLNTLFQSNRNSDFLWLGASRNSEEYNPLVMLMKGIGGELPLAPEDADILHKINNGDRHQYVRRLWSGRDLNTTSINTAVKIYPQFRLANVEKTFRINNSHFSEMNQQEAVYSFYLPSGAIATSLSLWINGKEEPARFTTRQKADSAYVSIVGIERRDPALMHWQEGNRITVTVFPCTPAEERQFKVGFTVPLHHRDGQLHFQDIAYEGPDDGGAVMKTLLHFDGHAPKDFSLPGFRIENDGWFSDDRFGNGTLNASLDVVPLSEKAFEWDGFSYQISEAKKRNQSMNFQRVYLDINNNWSHADFEAVMDLFKEKEVFVYSKDKMVKLNSENALAHFYPLQKLNYSLFPLYAIHDPENALIISQPHESSPLLEDLKDTRFLSGIESFAGKNPKAVKLFCLNKNESPYWKSLEELGLVQAHSGNADELKKLVNGNYFPVWDTHDNLAVISQSGAAIRKTDATVPLGGPDLLFRQFAHGQVMHRLARKHLTGGYDEEAVDLAYAANVVTPFTSLITLETEQDYQRFDIQEQDPKKSLGNSTLFGNGAVPEPHEWALIIFGALFLINLALRRLGINMLPF
ncbi:MAG: XrtN system VIT domain-containing protein [Bacteroidia bacterium]